MQLPRGFASARTIASLPFTTISLTLLSCLARTAALSTASDYYVRSLPGSPMGPLLRMHAGHIEVSEEHHGSLFFWHYQNKHIQGRQRTVIWLNGGPGCSSMDGNLMEVGPYRVRENGYLEYNKGSWDEYANLLFVDNPVGTGFSFVDSDAYIHELSEMADQFVVFLEKWFSVFPEYEHDQIFLSGESYAGQHIPYIAQAILDRNARADASMTQWDLGGLLIGNGWISAEYQSPANLDFALSSGLVQNGTDQARRLEDQDKRCREQLDAGEGDHVDTPVCEGVLQMILSVTRDEEAPADQQCVNMYDIKLRDSYPSCGMNWPPDLATVTPYLRDPRVISALHIDSAKKAQGWTECNGQVSHAFTARNSKPSYELLPGLLEKVPIVLFSGADDMICNHIGTERLIEGLEWNGGKGFPEDAETHEWTFDGEQAGTYRHARNLTYVLFYNSSHMVPFDYPERSRDMLDRFFGLEANLRHPGSVLHGEDAEETPAVALPPSSFPDQEETSTHESSSGGSYSGDGSVQDHGTSQFSDHDKSNPVVPGGASAQEWEEAEQERLQQVRWDAYYRSGEIALVFVILGAGFWGWYVLRDRRRRAGYRGVQGGSAGAALDGARDALAGGVRLEAFRHKQSDVEAGEENGHGTNGVTAEQARRYSLGSAGSDDDEDVPRRRQ